MRGKLLCMAAVLMAFGSAASAQGLKQIGKIDVPGTTLDNYDIGFVDTATHHYYLADRTNKSIDIFDSKAEKFLGRVAGFVGNASKGDVSGPDGVLAFGNEVWAGDGDSTVKVIDVKNLKVIDTISTGGKKRADEVAYDPKHHVFIIANDADEPPFLTLISTKPGHKILGKVVVERATDGIEQPYYNAKTGKFYVAIPQLDKDDHKGGIIVIDPVTAKLEKTIEVADCRPQGFDGGPGTHAILGCNAGSKGSKIPHLTAVWDFKTEKVVATTDKFGGADMATYNAKLGLYIVGGREAPGGPAIGVIDAKTNAWVANLPAPPNPHSVAANNENGHVYVPSAKIGEVGCGCVLVFGQ